MNPGDIAKPGLVAAVVLLVAVGLSSVATASFDFEFTTGDYALEVGPYDAAVFYTVVENTGTERDTIDLVLTEDMPGPWSKDVCIGGVCYDPQGLVILDAAEVETLLVDIYVNNVPNMGLVTMTGTMRGDPAKVKSETYAAFMNLPSILLVDDDAGAEYQTYLKAAVEGAGYKARVWDADSLGRPGPVQLMSYWGVLWTTADGDASYLTGTDEQDLMTYLDAGGKLFLASMGFLSSRGGATTLTTDYLHIASWTDDTGGSLMTGVPADPISDGMALSLVGGPFSSAGTDNMVSGAGAVSIFTGAGGVTGLRVNENDHKIVFISYPFEGVSDSDPDPDNQQTLVSRIIDWLDLPTAGVDGGDEPVGVPVVLRQNSPNPFSGSTCISFSLPAGGGSARLLVLDIEGRVVRTLISGGPQAGSRTVRWDGRDDAGRQVASGLYFYELSANGDRALKKMVLLR